MATKSEEDTHWGQLIFTHDSKPPVLISKDLVKLGRKEDCEISFAGCKFVSGHHCTITRDPDGKAWLQDFSTNGSLLNGKKINKDEKIQICHNDQVQIVHRKDHPGSDIAFVFQDLKFLREEAALLDNTLEYNNDTEEDVSEEEDFKPTETGLTSQKRSRSETGDTEEGPELKKKHEDEEGTSNSKKPELLAHNSIADTLLCSICQDIFHDCVSLQPCIHSFCASCYSQWMDRSSDCPSCRNKVERISKNHIINNLVEAFLKEHPERRRSEEELREMDSKNRITDDMLRPKHKRRGLFGSPSFIDDDDDDDDDDEEYSDDSDSHEREDDLVGVTVMPSSFGSLFGFSFSRPVPTSCRLCPGYITPAMPSCSASTSEGASRSVTPPDYTCTPDQMHILCQCCLQPMPNRWPDTMAGSIPTQKCSICLKQFCHLLWGCSRTDGCLGCLNKFTDFKFGENNMLSIINNNPCESKILKDYLIEQSLSEHDLLQSCLQKLDSKEYTTVDASSRDINSSTVLCYKCGMRNFQELAYQFRRDIPSDQLPASVRSRADCYWGKNCRTQKTKPLHANRFNHICEQTRFT